jgi:hypothetical protein
MTCLILELTDHDSWPQIHAIGDGPRRIPEFRRPTVLQPDRETAEKEALRLAAAHPGRRFVIFEPVSQGITVKVPTHVTLGGKTIVERDKAMLVVITDATEADDDLPF